MAQALERFTIDSAGARALLRSDGVRADLDARAQRVKAAAEGQVDSDVEIIADSYIGSGRAGATVIGVPMRIERRRRVLGGAVDAAG
jgi:hypothetical protein